VRYAPSEGIAVAVEFLDLQLQVSDQCLVVGLLSPNDCDLGASRDQRRFQRVNVVWRSFKTGVHAPDGIIKSAI
jgi:hypothetical protein